MLKLRFVSLAIPETKAKESRVKVTLSGITYTFHPSVQWMTELTRFAKAPPGVSVLHIFLTACSLLKF